MFWSGHAERSRASSCGKHLNCRALRAFEPFEMCASVPEAS